VQVKPPIQRLREKIEDDPSHHGGCSRAEVRGIPLLPLSILDLRKRKFLWNPKIFVVQDDLWCWHIPDPEFFACRVRRRVVRPFRIEKKPFDADAT
jgi:hypothetical protein